MNNKIRLLTIITKLELGGAQQVALQTMMRLNPDRYDLYLISGQGGLLDEQAKNMPGAQVHLWESFKHPIRPLCDLITFVRLVRFIRHHNIDIVHTHSSKAGILGRLAARVAGASLVVHTVHGWPFHDRQTMFMRRLYILLEKLVAPMTHTLVAVSRATRDKGLANGIGRPDQYQVIYPGSDLSQFAPADDGMRQTVRKAFGFDGEAPLIGMVACLKPQKAPGDFVRAAKKIVAGEPRARFLLIGDGQERGMVEQAVRKNGLEKVFKLVGWRDDVPQLMPALDILMLTSLWEGLPCVLGQAMASGVPIVATAVDGSREALADGTCGILVSPAMPEQAGDAALQLLNDPEQWKRMHRSGPVAAKAYDFSYMVELLEAVYRTHVKPGVVQ